jgi:hypothetical protein
VVREASTDPEPRRRTQSKETSRADDPLAPITLAGEPRRFASGACGEYGGCKLAPAVVILAEWRSYAEAPTGC